MPTSPVIKTHKARGRVALVAIGLSIITVGVIYSIEQVQYNNTMIELNAFSAAKTYYDNGEFADAQARFRLTLEKYPENALGHYYYAASIEAGGGSLADVIYQYKLAEKYSQDEVLSKNIQRALTQIDRRGKGRNEDKSSIPKPVANSSNDPNQASISEGTNPARQVQELSERNRERRLQTHKQLEELNQSADILRQQGNFAAATRSYGTIRSLYGKLKNESDVAASEVAIYNERESIALCGESSSINIAKALGVLTSADKRILLQETVNACRNASTSSALAHAQNVIEREIALQIERENYKTFEIALCNRSREPSIYAVLIIDDTLHAWYKLDQDSCKHLKFLVKKDWQSANLHVGASAKNAIWWNVGHVGFCINNRNAIETKLSDVDLSAGHDARKCRKDETFIAMRRGLVKSSDVGGMHQYDFKP